MLILAVFALFATACEKSDEIADTQIQVDASQRTAEPVALSEELPLLSIRVKDDIPAFSTMKEFLEAVDILELHSQESLLEWYKQKGIVTMYSHIFNESDVIINSLNQDDELANRFVSVDPVDGESMPSNDAMITVYKLLSPQGMVILGESIVYLSVGLQAWAPLTKKDAFIEAIHQYDVPSLEKFTITHMSEGYGSLGARSSETTVPPRCPWDLSSGSERTPENTNRTNNNKRQIRSWWSIAKITDPGNNSVSYRMGVYMKSYKRTFGYTTDHDWQFEVSFLRDGAVGGNFYGSWTGRFKSDTRSAAIEDVTYATPTNLSAVNIEITDFDFGNIIFTQHHHQGMGNEYNYLSCD